MPSVYSDAQYRTIFQSPFELSNWIPVLRDFFKARELKITPEQVSSTDAATTGYYLGNVDTKDSYRIGLFHYEIKRGSVANKLVGLRNLVRSFINPNWGEFDAALVTFDSGDHWRLSFISDIKGEETHPKRYTYVFGNPELRYNTPLERFALLNKEGISFTSLRKAFSVEALSDKFFEEYREHYADFVQYITGCRYEKVSGKWKEVKKHEANEMFARAFANNGKRVRDYIKKMMGRITFLHFLQRKGWMTGDLNYMWNLYERSEQKDNYLDAVLEPLFFGIMNTKPEERESVFIKEGWDIELLTEWAQIPYLNGGLFEREADDVPETVFPESYFTRLLKFFGEYNFTIDENDPNDAEIGVDPEMLGKIFENLLEDNKDKGAFYTPKEIVQYMCRESLISYLHRTTEFSLNNIRALVNNPEEGVSGLPSHQKEKLLAALTRVKICDPAIGSGAFPMGLLNELLRCREVLADSAQNRAELKKSIISNNIYGVDIEKGAVDIARLRFWLSIVVDEDSPSPLPNLDYKIMQGDSLRESFMGCDLSRLGQKERGKKQGKQKSFSFATEAIQAEFFFDESGAQEKMQELIKAYFDISSYKEKNNVRTVISSTIKEYIRFSGEGASSKIQDELALIDIPNNQFFLWHTFFGDVLGKGKNPGFDIIIGNPPYIQLQENEGYLGNLYKSCGFKSFAKSGDIYCLFYEQSWNLLREGGHLCFITSNKWMRAAYGQSLRSFLANNTNPKLLIDCGGYQVFKNATVDTNILLFSKEGNQGKTASITLPKSGVDNLSDFVQQHAVKCSFNTSDSWIILTPIEQSIKSKIEAIGKPLKEWDIQINYGIKTGYNDAFIISTDKRVEILNNCKDDEERSRTADLIRPILRGRDIKRYGYTWADLWLINAHNGVKGRIPRIRIEEYPALKAHLDSYWEKISSRADKGETPYNLRNCAYMEDFNQPKITWGEISDRSKFAFDANGKYVPEATTFLMTGEKLPYLLCVLNSPLTEWFFSKVGTTTGVGTVRWKKFTIQELLVPKADQQVLQQYNDLVTAFVIGSLTPTQLSQLANRIIYDMVGLSEDEISYVENFYPPL